MTLLFCLLLAASDAFAQSAGTYIGGYGEMNYKHFVNGDVPRLDISRFVIYLDHSFSNRWMFKSETEIEHVKIKGGAGGEIGIEQAYLDYSATHWLGWRGGLLVLPIGLMNQTHEPTTFYSVERPLFDQIVIPSTWAEIGTGIYGKASRTLHYQLYITEGLQTRNITMNGLDPAKQEGSAGAQSSDLIAGSDASHPAISGKLNFEPVMGLELGASGYVERGYTQKISRAFVLGDLDAQFQQGPLRIRAEGAFINTGDASDFSGVPLEIGGGYGEIAYDLFSLFKEKKSELDVFVRYEQFAFRQREPVEIGGLLFPFTTTWSQHQAITGGVAYKPMNELILKADYRWTNVDAGLERREFALGAGYVF
ncbi:MAG TPA: hypothetical protein VFD13_07400 [Candidatus Kapabacteria bacterium]|nr:hypothetical protein [Candidatus Kapabacteria bacterium]